MITLEKFRKVAEIISEMANIPPGVRDPLAEAAAAWTADCARIDLLETAMRARGFVCKWHDTGDLILVPLGEAALQEAQHE